MKSMQYFGFLLTLQDEQKKGIRFCGELNEKDLFYFLEQVNNVKTYSAQPQFVISTEHVYKIY